MNLLIPILATLSVVWVMTQGALVQNNVRSWGEQFYRPGDDFLTTVVFMERGHFWSIGTNTFKFVYPDKNETNNRTITMIRVTDQVDDSHSRNAMILDGGVGNEYVTMEFKAPRRHGYSFIVEIFGCAWPRVNSSSCCVKNGTV